MPWQVVEFLPHGNFTGLTVQTVPAKWIKLEGNSMYSFYPKSSYNWGAVTRAIKSQATPSAEWEKLEVKFVTCPFETLEEAVAIERKIADCDATDLETFMANEMEDGKRKRKKRNMKYPNESSSSEGVEMSMVIPLPPSLESWVPERPPMRHITKECKPPRTSTSHGTSSSKASCSKGVQCLPDVTDKSIQVSAVGRNFEVMDFLSSMKEQVMEEIRELKSKFSGHILEQREALSDVHTRLLQLSEKIGDSSLVSQSSVGDCQTMYNFPLKDANSLIDLEVTLTENQRYKEYLICFLKERSTNIMLKCSADNHLSAGLNKTVNNMCSIIMSNDLAVNFCMKGRSEQKISFELHFKNIIDVIFESVKAKAVPGVSVDLVSVKRSLGEWLRVSKYRTDEGKRARKSVTREACEEDGGL